MPDVINPAIPIFIVTPLGTNPEGISGVSVSVSLSLIFNRQPPK